MRGKASEVEVERISAACGAEIRGADLSRLDESTLETIRVAWREHQVLFFRDQTLAPASHKAFAERFGPLEIHPHAAPIDPAYPEVCLLHSEQGGRADVWHSDVTYTPSPPIAAIVRYVKGPEVGGDTLWSNGYLAYEKLSDAMKALLEGLSALHASTLDADLCCEHPVVRVHPESGRRSLFVNRLFTTRLQQLLPGESRALLAYLFAWCEQPEFTCRWSWRPGDVVMWDNRCVQHYAINDYLGERILHRCMVLGDPPVGPGPQWAAPDAPEIESSRTRADARAQGRTRA